jgi:hypothetical protein
MSARYFRRDVSSIAPSTAPAADVGNVVDFPVKNNTTSAFDQPAARLVLPQFRAGTLSEGVFLSLRAAATGLRP